MRRFWSTALATILGAAVWVAPPSFGLASTATHQVSVTPGGADAKRDSAWAAVSGDGRYVTFQSLDEHLVPGRDRNGDYDVFVRDLETGTTIRASVDVGGGDPQGGSFSPTLNADGRYLAFLSSAPDLVTDDGNGTTDVFVRDLVMGTTVRASVDAQGGDANGPSGDPAISADGRFVAFSSDASDLVPGDGHDVEDVFVRDLLTGTTVRASVDTGGGNPDDNSWNPIVSGDGRLVAFSSWAPDLVDFDRNAKPDVFVRDLVTNTTAMVSVTPEGLSAHGDSYGPSISNDGLFVAFYSGSKELVDDGDDNGASDVFVRDLALGTTVRASLDRNGGDSDDQSFDPALSADGRYVAFTSWASDLVALDGNHLPDVFVRDLERGVTVRASLDVEGGDPDGGSGPASLSAAGRVVAFDSYARDLVPGRGDKLFDIFVTRLA